MKNIETLISKSVNVTRSRKVKPLLSVFPETLDEKEQFDSLALNLLTDYTKIITKLPKKFNIAELCYTHVGNSNQFDIQYNFVSKRFRFNNVSVACLSFYFLDTKNSKELILENIQGNIRLDDRQYSYKQINHVFDKLRTFYGVDWRQGLFQQVYNYGKKQGMTVRGKIPGMFYDTNSFEAAYPLYALNYLGVYLQIGIHLDDIVFKKSSDKWNSHWQNVVSYLKNKSPEERIILVKKAAKEYRTFFTRNKHIWKYEHKMDEIIFKKNCENEYKRIFSEILS